MNLIRKKGQDLQELIDELKVGDNSIYDEVTCWDITRVPGGLIYKNEYAGAVFVPYEPKKAGRPPMSEKKIDKPVNTKRVVTK